MSKEITKSAPVVVRSAVPARASYHDYKDDLRFDFWYSCAYCTISEIEASGISFEIDHHQPAEKFKDLINEYSNLMWCCDQCNRIKGDEYPNDSMQQRGLRFLRPDEDDPDDHFEVQNVTDLRKKTPIGDYSIRTIRLNRHQLKKLRELRYRIYQSQQGIAQGVRALRQMRLDHFPPDIRWRVGGVKASLENQSDKSSLEEALRQYNRSVFLDIEPNRKQENKRRREYLKQQHAVLPPD